jgi:hypothetical protein
MRVISRGRGIGEDRHTLHDFSSNASRRVVSDRAASCNMVDLPKTYLDCNAECNLSYRSTSTGPRPSEWIHRHSSLPISVEETSSSSRVESGPVLWVSR